MTQVKLWQILSQTPNAIIIADAEGNLTTLPSGQPDQILVIGANGTPAWTANTALSAALEAKAETGNALATAKAYTDAQIAALVDNAPLALDTLNELAQKLSSDENAFNALLLQVDGKADKNAVTTAITDAKQEVLQAAKGYTDAAVAAGNADAIRLAGDFTTQQIGGALAVAATDAANKAALAKDEAITAAASYTDNAVATSALASATDATQKAEAAKLSALNEAKAYTDNELESLPGRLFARTTATACFLISTGDRSAADGLPLSSFTEVTGAALQPYSSLKPKLLFVNGLAASSDWTSENGTLADTRIHFNGRLLSHAFDGSDNAIMLLCEYTTDSEIYAVAKPSYTPPAPIAPNGQ